MTEAQFIIDRLGASSLADRLGVSSQTVRHVRWQGHMPSSWYAVTRAMCREAGIECPMSAFNWKIPHGDDPTSLQGGLTQ